MALFQTHGVRVGQQSSKKAIGFIEVYFVVHKTNNWHRRNVDFGYD